MFQEKLKSNMHAGGGTNSNPRTRKRKRERSNNRGNTSQPDEHQLTETVVPITTEDTSQHIDIEQVQSPAETSTSVVSSQDATEAAAALSDPSSVADNSATGNEQSTPLVIDLERLPLSNSSDVVDLTKDTGPKFIDLTADDSPIPTASYRFIDNWYRPRRFRQTRRSSARQAASSSTLSDTQNDSLEELPQVLPNFSLSASPSHQNTPSPAKRNITCPICMDDEKQIVRGHRQLMSTLCGHVFCDKCIREAVQVQHKCPTCRRKLTQRQMHPLFI